MIIKVVILNKGSVDMNFISKKELAEKLSISIVTIDRLRKQGLPFHNVGKKVVFVEEEVSEWILKGEKDNG